MTSQRPHHEKHHHRDIQGGTARAAVFGVSDGLVSNVALILGFAGANADPANVQLASIAGLVAGACSMAAGEYISMKAQVEIAEREIDRERQSISEHPEVEEAELADQLVNLGVGHAYAQSVAAEIHQDEEKALEVHVRQELGTDIKPEGSPWKAALASFVTFAVGAGIPALPWFIVEPGTAFWSTLVLSALGALAVGWLLASFTLRSRVWSALRQLVIAAATAGVTYAIGLLFGVGT